MENVTPIDNKIHIADILQDKLINYTDEAGKYYLNLFVTQFKNIAKQPYPKGIHIKLKDGSTDSYYLTQYDKFKPVSSSLIEFTLAEFRKLIDQYIDSGELEDVQGFFTQSTRNKEIPLYIKYKRTKETIIPLFSCYGNSYIQVAELIGKATPTRLKMSKLQLASYVVNDEKICFLVPLVTGKHLLYNIVVDMLKYKDAGCRIHNDYKQTVVDKDKIKIMLYSKEAYLTVRLDNQYSLNNLTFPAKSIEKFNHYLAANGWDNYSSINSIMLNMERKSKKTEEMYHNLFLN